MTADELQDLKERLEKLPPGPWGWYRNDDDTPLWALGDGDWVSVGLRTTYQHPEPNDFHLPYFILDRVDCTNENRREILEFFADIPDIIERLIEEVEKSYRP